MFYWDEKFKLIASAGTELLSLPPFCQTFNWIPKAQHKPSSLVWIFRCSLLHQYLLPFLEDLNYFKWIVMQYDATHSHDSSLFLETFFYDLVSDYNLFIAKFVNHVALSQTSGRKCQETSRFHLGVYFQLPKGPRKHPHSDLVFSGNKFCPNNWENLGVKQWHH